MMQEVEVLKTIQELICSFFSEEQFTLSTSLLKLTKHSQKPKLILLCSGTSDSTVGDIPEGYHNILTENQVDHIWYLYPDGGHSYEVWLSGLINFLQRI